MHPDALLFCCNLVPSDIYVKSWNGWFLWPEWKTAALSVDYWQEVVLLAGSAPGEKPLLRLLGLRGKPVDVSSTLALDSMTEQLFCGSRGWTSMDFGITDACLSPSPRSGGLVRARPVGVASGLTGLGLRGGEGLWALWSSNFDSASCGTCWSGEGTSLSLVAEPKDSGGGSCCMLLCREVPEPWISQLSVRRREPSCIRLVATTAFMAAFQHTRQHFTQHRMQWSDPISFIKTLSDLIHLHDCFPLEMFVGLTFLRSVNTKMLSAY